MTNKNLTSFPILKTARLSLRQPSSSDDEQIFALRSNDNVNKYLGRAPARSIDDARNFIKAINENIQKKDSVYWVITFNGNDKPVGTICLFDFSEDKSKAEIGYELLPDFQGQGIMQEAISVVIQFALQDLGLNLIKAYTHFENQRSTSLLEKLHFKRTSTIDENFVVFELTHNG